MNERYGIISISYLTARTILNNILIFLNLFSSVEGFMWISSTDNPTLDDAVLCDQDTPKYVCRVLVDDVMWAGNKVSDSGCYIIKGGQREEHTTYDVLVHSSPNEFGWLKYHLEYIEFPVNALVIGENGGDEIYSIRRYDKSNKQYGCGQYNPTAGEAKIDWIDHVAHFSSGGHILVQGKINNKIIKQVYIY